MATDHDEFLEQLKFENAANRRKNEFLERKTAALEKEVCELRASVSTQESRVSLVGALEKEIRQLKFTISKLESMSHDTESAIGVIIASGSDAALKKAVDMLGHKMMQLELDSLMSVKTRVANVEQRNAELEKRLTDLTITIDKLKSTSFEPVTDLKTAMELEPEVGCPEMNDLVGYLLLLIFLVSVLIGVSL